MKERLLRPGMKIRIIDSNGVGYGARPTDRYYGVTDGAILVVKKSDIQEDHMSNRHEGQQCFRSACGILWEEFRPIIII